MPKRYRRSRIIPCNKGPPVEPYMIVYLQRWSSGEMAKNVPFCTKKPAIHWPFIRLEPFFALDDSWRCKLHKDVLTP